MICCGTEERSRKNDINQVTWHNVIGINPSTCAASFSSKKENAKQATMLRL
jgi:hypothetical protein